MSEPRQAVLKSCRLMLLLLAAAVCPVGCGSDELPTTADPPETQNNDNAASAKNSANLAEGEPSALVETAEAGQGTDTADDAVADSTDDPESAKTEPDKPRNVKRMVVLTGGGPLVVDVALTIDGRSSQQPSDDWIDQLLAAADTDEDGRPTWDEAVESPRLAFDSFAGSDAGNREERIRLYDRDRDGVVDRSEMWSLVSHGDAAGVAFRLRREGGMGNMAAPVATVKQFLDIDGNGQLSSDEIAAAPARLKLADIDDDDLLTAAELQRTDLAAMTEDVRMDNYGQPLPAMLLDRQTSWGAVYYELKERYHYGGPFGPDSFPLVPHLVEALDRDGNGELDRDEVVGLAEVESHLLLSVALGVVDGDGAARLEIAHIDPMLGNGSYEQFPSQAGARVELAGMTLDFSAYDNTGANAYAASARQAMDAGDADKNGYLELDEIGQERADEFSAWDMNSDGRVFLDELNDAFGAQQAPLLSRVEAVVTESRQSLFAALDVSRDGRLSAREMQSAADRFQSLDQNEDGRLAGRELPGRITMVFGRGQPVADPTAAAAAYDADQSSVGLAWFTGMDSNRDGDVSRREFLGPLAIFARLDADADGFLSAAEAQQATSDDDPAPREEPVPQAGQEDSGGASS